MKKYFILILLGGWALGVFAQSDNILTRIKPRDRSFVREGNEQFEAGRYSAAESFYRKSLAENPDNNAAQFNLGVSLYAQERWADAAQAFGVSAQRSEAEDAKATAFYNQGNAFLKSGENTQEGPQQAMESYKNAVEAYKQSLRLEPGNHDAKYNLAYALQKLREQQQEGGQSSENQQNQQDQDNSQQNDDQQQNEQDSQNGEDQNSDSQQNESSQQQQNQQQSEQRQGEQQAGQQLSREQIERLLDMLREEEEKLQGRMQQSRQRGEVRRVEKDW